ncbi:RNA 2'-phosphotransferase [Anatilimnocola floriformis]|uniref:RNA 2'-phosphotransferase n=1 Tax=Anatilimnocola floriformis TaxID=2948575 RepID=UPI0020C2571D|nr:RNA 2'-phosphotransferase [Anatilimnocola floriformis]
MNAEKRKKISKSLSYVLRHQPDSVGLELGENGWVEVTELIAAFRKHGKELSLDSLREVVAENDKQRFEFSEDKTRIRARQGHSVDVDLGYEAATPPELLFHGTAVHNLDSIMATGLNKGNRHHVHLSTNKQTMLQVAQRHGKPVVLAVAAGKMVSDGHLFFVTGNQVWLTEQVPPQYLSVNSD